MRDNSLSYHNGDTFQGEVCLFCSQIFFNIMEFYEIVIQMRGLTSHVTFRQLV